MRHIVNLWRNLIAKRKVEDQLDAELRSYVDLLEAENIHRGIDPPLARRQALLAVEGLEQVKEHVRDARSGRRLEILASDLYQASRTLGKMPFTAAVVILSLGIGIGVNTTIFSWIQAVVFEPIPSVAQSASYQQIETRTDNGLYPGVSWPEYIDLRARLTAFRGLLAFRMVPFYVGESGSAERIYGLLVSGNYFPLLGLKPSLGRLLQPEDAAHPGGEPIVVISNAYWRTHFNSSPNALGQAIRVNNSLLTVVGVTPERFQGTVLGLDFSLWAPATLAPVLLSGSNELADRSQRGYDVMGRRKPGQSQAAAQAQLNAAMFGLAKLYPETNAKMRGEILPFWRSPHGPQRILATSLAVLQGIMLLLLLAVSSNTATLLLARSTTRQREIGIRLALGAGPWRIVSLLFAENFLLAFLGACLGVLLAIWGTGALRAVPMITRFPIRFQTGIDALDLAFAIGLALLCALIFGISPATHLAQIDPQIALRSSASLSPPRSRGALMGAEVALAVIVLIVAALFLKSFGETRAANPGFRRDGILLASYDLTGRNRTDADARTFASRLLLRLRALRSVQGGAIAVSVPLDIHGMPNRSFVVEGHARPSAQLDQALTNTVTPGYFAAMGIQILAGVDFVDLDNTSAPPQAIVNEEFVHRFIETGEPLGRTIRSRDRTYVISAVVRNSVYEAFDEQRKPMLYLSFRDRPMLFGEIHIKTHPGAETLLVSDLRRILRDLDPTLSVYDARTMNDHVEKNAFLRRIPAQMFLVLGPLLLILAAIGIYAVVSYSVEQRTKEIGLRLALGATVGRVVSQIAGQTFRVVWTGTCIGWLIAALIDVHLNRGVLYWPVFVGVPLILLSVAAFACGLPAHRAARLDPMIALRQD